jgi:hypothetical protein
MSNEVICRGLKFNYAPPELSCALLKFAKRLLLSKSYATSAS